MRAGIASQAFSAIASRFASVPKGPEDAILGVTLAYRADPSPLKLNLGVGAYRDDQGRPFVLPAVRQAERRILEADLDMEYLPVAGDREFLSRAVRLAYSDHLIADRGHTLAAVQTISGTGALRLAAEFLRRYAPGSSLLLPSPSWANHTPIFRDAGCDVQSYRYYDPSTKSLDFAGLMEDLARVDQGSTVLLHTCAHNPTGVDPSEDQWKEISAVMHRRQLYPLFDMAYQGFATGDGDVDAFPIRHFLGQGHRPIVAQSFSKNFGLYGHRVGALSIVGDDVDEKDAMESQLKIIARPMYSNPPIHGVRIINEILSSDELTGQWKSDMKGMADRIRAMREQLRQGLESRGNPQSWRHITDQIGMFCFTGLTPTQVIRLRDEFHIYLTQNGRISMAGVAASTVDYLAEAMDAVTRPE